MNTCGILPCQNQEYMGSVASAGADNLGELKKDDRCHRTGEPTPKYQWSVLWCFIVAFNWFAFTFIMKAIQPMGGYNTWHNYVGHHHQLVSSSPWKFLPNQPSSLMEIAEALSVASLTMSSDCNILGILKRVATPSLNICEVSWMQGRPHASKSPLHI